MAKAKQEKLNFSKFFPDTTNFIVVSGEAKSPTDFDLSVEIGDGDNKASFYLSDWMKGDLGALKAIQEGVQKAIDFHQKAIKLPKVDVSDPWSVWDNNPAKTKPVKRVLKSTETKVKKAVKK